MARTLITLENAELDDLPLLALKLIRLIGYAKAMRLIELRPGVAVYIPESVEPNHWLTLELGVHAATVLVKNWAGMTITPPNCKLALIKIRHRQVRATRAQGYSQTETALLYDLTPRQVRNIESAVPEEDRNGSLF